MEITYWLTFTGVILLFLVLTLLVAKLWKKENYCQDIYRYGAIKTYISNFFLIKLFLTCVIYGNISLSLAGPGIYLGFAFVYTFTGNIYSIVATYKTIIFISNVTQVILMNQWVYIDYISYEIIPVAFGTFLGLLILNYFINSPSKREVDFKFNLYFLIVSIVMFLLMMIMVISEFTSHQVYTLNQLFNFNSFCE